MLSTLSRCCALALLVAAGAVCAQTTTPAPASDAAPAADTKNTYKKSPLPPTTPELIKRRADVLRQRFDKADTDHDGFLTREEAQKGLPMAAKHFDEIDTKHTGKVSSNDVITYISKRHVEPTSPAPPMKPAPAATTPAH